MHIITLDFYSDYDMIVTDSVWVGDIHPRSLADQSSLLAFKKGTITANISRGDEQAVTKLHRMLVRSGYKKAKTTSLLMWDGS